MIKYILALSLPILIACSPTGSVANSALSQQAQLPNQFISQAPAWATIIPQSQWQDYTSNSSTPLYFKLLNNQIKVNKDGSIHHFAQMVIDGNTPQSIRDQGRQNLLFNPDFESVQIHAVKLHRLGQAIDVTDQLKKFIQPTRNDLPSIYTGMQELVFEIPNIQTGDQMEVQFSKVGINPIFTNRPWSVEFFANSSFDTAFRTIEFSWPASLEIHPFVLPASSPKQSQQNVWDRLDFEHSGYKHVRFSGKNIPAPFIEEAAASGTTQIDLLGFSSFASKMDVVEWGLGLLEGVPTSTSEVFHNKVKELKKFRSPEEQASAALVWLQRDIRYVSLSLGENSHRPYSPDEVIKRGYGDCKDKSLLLIHLLRALGIEAHAALMNQQNPNLPSRMPNLPHYDHMVVVVSINGQDFVLDATFPEQASPLHQIGHWHAGADLLVLSGPKQGFMTAPDTPDALQSTLLYEESMSIQPDGRTGILEVHKTLHGVEAEQMRWTLSAQPIEHIKAHYLGLIREQYPRATWAKEPQVEDAPDKNTLTLKGEFNIPNPLRRAQRGQVEFTLATSFINSQIYTAGGLDRLTPVGFGRGLRTVEVINRFALSQGWRLVKEPIKDNETTLWFDFSIQQGMKTQNVFEDKRTIKRKVDRVESHELEQYLEAAENVFQFGNLLTLQAP